MIPWFHTGGNFPPLTSPAPQSPGAPAAAGRSIPPGQVPRPPPGRARALPNRGRRRVGSLGWRPILEHKREPLPVGQGFVSAAVAGIAQRPGQAALVGEQGATGGGDEVNGRGSDTEGVGFGIAAVIGQRLQPGVLVEQVGGGGNQVAAGGIANQVIAGGGDSRRIIGRHTENNGAIRGLAAGVQIIGQNGVGEGEDGSLVSVQAAALPIGGIADDGAVGEVNMGAIDVVANPAAISANPIAEIVVLVMKTGSIPRIWMPPPTKAVLLEMVVLVIVSATPI